MSEYIKNTEIRKEGIKNILKQLHAGRTVESLKAEFASLLEGTNAATITEVEQMLLAEGLPVEEIQRLCDLHTSVFHDALEQQSSPEMTPGHPAHTLLAENQAAEQVLDNLVEAVSTLKQMPNLVTIKLVRTGLERMREIEKHYVRKENLLFPYLEKYKFYGPSQVMWGIQNEIRAGWKALGAVLDAGPVGNSASFTAQVEEIFSPLEKQIREMFYKEAKILLPAALERLKVEDWEAIRSQEEPIGYCYLPVVPQWQAKPPEKAVEKIPAEAAAAKQPVKGGMQIRLNTGVLSPHQIDLMLRALPVDVTYVDENDNVRYYSETKQRIFQRNPAIIGRRVQDCHPPQSLARVQRILDDFRSGKRDEAQFWIQMGKMFVVIGYTALRDADGTYRGALEVTQDAAPLRALQGERRLLNETENN